jgi:hypothetical protein
MNGARRIFRQCGGCATIEPVEPPNRFLSKKVQGIAIQLGIAVILIIAILVTGSIAISAARQSANRQRSSNNLKRLGVAIRAYEKLPASLTTPTPVDSEGGER